MDQFLTTYRKDFLWPYVTTIGTKAEQKPKSYLCPCHCIEPPLLQEHRKVFGPESVDKQEWSRTGPMGPLLDPKLYPSRVGASPEVETSRYDQPNTFLRKLNDKYPFLYNVLQSAPPDDLISRVNRDRLKTTYQVDYCKAGEFPSDDYENLLRASGVQGLPPCPEPVRLPGDPQRPNQRSVAFRPGLISKTAQGGGGGGDEGSGKSEGGIAPWTPGRSEYQEGISKLGGIIVKAKLHSQTKKTS